MLDFARFECISFDCYGTLIDWETGILAALRPILERHSIVATREQILALYGELEPAEQRRAYRPYREILKLLAEGNSVKEIAVLLGLSVKTVEAHKFNLMRKLDIHNKAQLVTYAIQKKIIKIPVNQ